MLTLTEHIAACMEQAAIRRQLAKTSHKMYAWHLRCYAIWKQGRTSEPILPTPADLVAYFDWLQQDPDRGGKGYRPRTMQSCKNAIGFFDAWLVKSGVAPARVMPGDYPWPRLDAAEKPSTSKNEGIASATAVAALAGDPLRCALARAVFYTLMTTAIRLNELLGLDLRDYSAEECSLTVRHGKGDKRRKVYISDDCRQALDSWLLERPENTLHKALFCWDRIRRLGETGVYSLLDDISAAAGLEEGRRLRPHSMRRGCATRLLRGGIDLDKIRVILGHSSTKTTEIYLETSSEALAETRNAATLVPPVPLVEPQKAHRGAPADVVDRRGFGSNGRRRRRAA